jgi:hypothetical protein
MSHNQRRPAWWRLYALILVPVIGGLLLAESPASLSPGAQKAVQIGIILWVFGLVWVWIWANDVALRQDRQVLAQDHARPAPETDYGATSWALDPGFRASQAYDSGIRLYTTGRCTNIRSNGREIRKCSRN